MSGFRGVAEAYEAQWTAHLNSAVANAFRQTLAEKPPDPVARIGRLLTARVDGPAPQLVPPQASPWDPMSQAHSDTAYNSRWSAHINAMFTQAWKQTFTARPADPVVHLGHLLLAFVPSPPPLVALTQRLYSPQQLPLQVQPTLQPPLQGR